MTYIRSKKQELKFQCRNIDKAVFDGCNELKEKLGVTYGGLLEYLYNKHVKPFEVGLSSRQEVEKAINSMLLDKSTKINHTTLRKETGSRSQMLNEVMALFKDEIEQHNSKVK